MRGAGRCGPAACTRGGLSPRSGGFGWVWRGFHGGWGFDGLVDGFVDGCLMVLMGF